MENKNIDVPVICTRFDNVFMWLSAIIGGIIGVVIWFIYVYVFNTDLPFIDLPLIIDYFIVIIVGAALSFLISATIDFVVKKSCKMPFNAVLNIIGAFIAPLGSGIAMIVIQII